VLKHHLLFADSAGGADIVSFGASLAGVFAFLLVVYYWLPNTELTWREALPGATAGALVLEVSFLALPFFVRHASVNVTLRTLGGPAILIVWLYVMANVIVFGAEINWWWRERRRHHAEARERRGHGESAPPSTSSRVPRPSAPHPPE